MKTKILEQTIEFECTTHEFYEIIMDSEKHSLYTGGEALITPRVGGKFTAWDGYIEGKTIELIEDEKIVQTWRNNDFPEGYESTVIFELEKTPTGTKLHFKHKDVPAKQARDLNEGWKKFYWKPIIAELKKRTDADA